MAGYELFIGLRYLKAKRKQTFVSIVTFISILGVMVVGNNWGRVHIYIESSVSF